MEHIKGSEWKKWDLQVQPAENDWCNNFDPKNSGIIHRIRSFLDKAIEQGIKVIAITDHNFGGSIDVALTIKAQEKLDIEILPGVELNATEGWHILIIFNPEWKEKCNLATWCDAVRNFFSMFKVNNPCDNQGNVPIGVTTKELLKEICHNDIGILFFSHCLGDKGFFKRGNNDSRKELIKMSLDEGYLFGFDIKNPNGKNEIEKEIQNCLSDNTYKLHLPVICSSDANRPNLVGQSFCWIKSDPTYEGLKQILYEPEERIFLGDEPDILKRVRENKTKLIRCLRINQVKGYDESKGIWFKNVEIPFNPGLVAIIGNKGMGKSAITDIIGLCANSHNYKDFSFLREDRFLKDNLAGNFEAELVWESDECIRKNLLEKVDYNSPERVRYIPQSFFEQLTNNLETYEFEKTLENLVFSYLPEEERLGASSFEELIKSKKEIIDKKIQILKSKISEINIKIIDLEKKLHPDYRKNIDEKLKIKKGELDEHEKIKPKEVPDPSKDPSLSEELREKSKELNKYNEKLKTLLAEIDNRSKFLKNILQIIEGLKKLENELRNKEEELKKYIEENRVRYQKLGLNIEEILSFSFKIDLISSKLEDEKSTKDKIEKSLNELNQERHEIETKLKELSQQLTEPQKKYQKYLDDLRNWENKKNQIIGDERTFDTLKWYENELKYVEEELEHEISNQRRKRLEIVRQIYEQKLEVLNFYKTFKEAITNEINKFKDFLSEYQIEIDASFRIKSSFYDDFLRHINQRAKGSFRGEMEGRELLKNLIKDKNFDNWDTVRNILEEIIIHLEEDRREEGKGERRFIKDQILGEEKWLELYNYLFTLDYLEPIYELKLSNKRLTELSPGERGALLVIFYLLLDKSEIPLVIDQPEENLDNETVYRILTHFIKYTKKRRQLILVTHNPNLAIVGDAEQIIFVSIDKANKNEFHFKSGSIENSEINKHASDVLEGTLKAFDNRRLKYLRKTL